MITSGAVGMSEMIRLDAIKKGAQARDRMNEGAIEDYARAMREGAQFPPIVVFREDDTLWLADGFHRLEATRCAGRRRSRSKLKRAAGATPCSSPVARTSLMDCAARMRISAGRS
jgi:uncharacterized protein (DUF1015 family)